MKKLILYLLLFAMVLSATGCLTRGQKWGIPTEGQPKPDVLLVENDRYTISRKNGQCYLNFADGNVSWADQNGKDYEYFNRPSFASLEALRNSLMGGGFSAEVAEHIKEELPKDENGILIYDPTLLYLPTSGAFVLGAVELGGNSYSISLTPTQAAGLQFTGQFYVHSRDSFVELMKLTCPSLVLEDGTVRVNGREQFSDSWQKTEVYLRTFNGKSLLVVEKYDINDGVVTETPSGVTLYGMLEDRYYSITLKELTAVPDLTMFEDLQVALMP
ncbi:MAG: hypothetical protein IJX13_06850 [Clostridia bacterium]|nr:hypothetical protein [Clostridia bacterium]